MKRIEYIDALRGFTMILVVFAHISLYAYHEDVITFGRVFVQFHMALFFFISGFILYKHERVWAKETLYEFFRQKFKVQIIPTMCFLFVYALLFDVAWDTIWQDKYKGGYWFTLSLFEYFVLYVFFDGALQKMKIRGGKYDILLCLFALMVFAVSTGHAATILNNVGVNNKVLGFLQIAQLKYFVFFCFGTFVRKHFTYCNKLADNGYAMGFIVLLFGAGVLWGYVLLPPALYPLVFLLNGFSGVVLVFYFFRRHEQAFTLNSHKGRWLQYIGRRTLDIYLLHYFFLPRHLEAVGAFFKENPNPTIELFVSGVLSLMVIALCLAVSSIIRLSPVLAYWLFGVKAKKQQ